MKYRNYLLNPRYWRKAAKKPKVAYDNFLAILKHPLLYVKVSGKVEGLLDHYVGSLLYDTALSHPAPSPNIVEIGAYKGLLTVYLSIAAAQVNKRVKSFELFSGLTTGDPDLDTGFHPGQYASEISEYKANLKEYGKEDVVDLTIGDARQTMLPALGDDGFSLAFIDVGIYAVMRDLLLQLWSIAKGGEVIIIDDIDSPGIRKALDEFHNVSHFSIRECILHGNTISKLELPKLIN